ncbi:MAG: carbohydrate-binding protein, partial [Oscillospiraceae bacterium]
MVLKKILAAGVTCSLLATMSLSAFSGLSVSGQTPKNGLGVKNLITKDGITSIEAEDYESLAGGKIMFDSAASGGTHIGDFYANCKAYYKINVADAGTYQITLKIATPQGGTVTVNTPSVEAEPVKFDATGGWQAYKDVVLNLWLNKGEQIISVDNLRLTWNFDKIEFKYLNDKQELSNIIKKANVYASSGNAEALKDYDKGKVWQAEKNDNQWITMRFNREFTINSIKLFDSAKTHIKSGNVIFSDGTSKQFGELSKDGTVISFENKNVTWLKIDSLKSSDTSENPALAEAEIMGIAKVDSTLGIDTALESFVKTNNEWKKMIDSLKEIEIKNNCIEFAWPGKYIINNVKLSGLQIGNNTKLTGKIEINYEEISFDENIQNGI